MSKVERLNARVAKLLTVAVHEVLEVVRETVSEYQEKTARTQRENERLKRKLQELEEKQKRVNAGTDLPVIGPACEKTPAPQEDTLLVKDEQRVQSPQDTKQNQVEAAEQIIIKCDSLEDGPVILDEDCTDESDQEGVHFVACYNTSATTAAVKVPSVRRRNQKQTRKCKEESDCVNALDTRTTAESKLFADEQLCLEGGSGIQNSGLAGTQQPQPQHLNSLSEPSVNTLNASPPNGPHSAGPSTADYPYLPAMQIKAEADMDDCSNSAPLREDYVTAGFDSLRDELELPSQDLQAEAEAVAVAASSLYQVAYVSPSANGRRDGLFLDSGYEVSLEAGPNGLVGGPIGAGPLNRRGPGGGGGAGRLPRPYTRRHHSHAAGVPKRYCCPLCGRSFNHAGDFKKHKRVHTGEKPYGCGVCGKRFSQSGYLTVHLRYHTGERPYSCDLCGKSFSHSSNFRKHQQTHVGHAQAALHT
ncbi:hypothetical protein ACEWY4_026429 [Coilia grayii]|uniref:C2H2-type domain-containing protein n=1 Tax=Coilia grayii TaxID=363190 RepID=A0ABD1IVT8_9TELE